MHLYRPKSFLNLVLIGFFFVSLPLVVALVNAELSMGRLARLSAQVVYRSVKATEASRLLVEDLIVLERKARQYEVLGEELLQREMEVQHREIQTTLRGLLLLSLEPTLHASLDQLLEEETSVFSVLQTEPRKSPAREAALARFTRLNELANRIAGESQALIYREVDLMQKSTEKTQQELIWQAVALVPFSILFVGLFSHWISRPIRQMVAAINRLGSGDFDTEVRVGGTHDLRFLGHRLDWMRNQLADVERSKSKFVAQVSHELKTPLASIREGAELLNDNVVGDLNHPQREIVEILCKSSRDLQKLIENLLGFSKVQAGANSVLDLGEVELSPLIDEVLADHRALVMKKNLDLDLDVEPLTVPADRVRLRTVIDNLVSNAVKFTPPGGRIHILCRPKPEGWVLDVSDSGPGIPKEDQDKIFLPFYQGRLPSPGHVKGTGLGLSIAREIALAHGGELSLIDGGPPGCRFRLALPFLKENETA
jgi:two-component system sensor histidine kinase GlrK